ncbi:unnamed protein product [Paramecium sonneborni]|uniref:Transmembrane protein n=1 Tax=Paramecium sonneborni TaxID=65129 RepID=A0A8S1N728_9CILI|nr:unnamed protein product [Paramecium sonneborni]
MSVNYNNIIFVIKVLQKLVIIQNKIKIRGWLKTGFSQKKFIYDILYNFFIKDLIKMNILFFLNVLFKSQAIESTLQTKIYNFPMEVGQSNTIYLQEYTPEIFQAPFYQIRKNELNITLLQSISQIYYQTLIPNELIQLGSNYIIQSELFSNNFWIYTQKQTLLQGTIENNGEFQLTQLNMKFKNCFYLNLISNNFGMLSCINNGVLQFNLINSTSKENTNYLTNYTFINLYTNPSSYIRIQNTSSFTIQVVYTTTQNAVIAFFIYNNNNIYFQNQLIFNGNYTQAILSQNFNYFFLMNSQFVYLVNLETTEKVIQKVIDHSSLNSQNQQPFTQMAILQITNNTFHIVILQNLMLTSFQLEIHFIQQFINMRTFILNEYQQIKKIEVTIANIYIITNQFILKLQCKSSIMATNYYQLKEGTFGLIQLLREIVIVQEYVKGQSILSTYLLSQPQILISENESQLIQNYNEPILLDILVNSQSITQSAQYVFKLQIYQVNITLHQCPLLYEQQMDNLFLKYPEQLIIPKNKIFLGPNLTVSMTSNNSQYLYVGVPVISYGLWTIQKAIYLVICAWIQSIEIYCTQYQNQTIQISLWNPYFNGQSFFVNSTQNITHCQCFQSISEIQVLLQFNQTISIQKFNHQLNPDGDMIQFNYTVPILSSVILQKTLFVITNDGNLIANSLNNQQPVFTISSYQFNCIYINQIDYPNFLFIDNVYELIILSYNGQKSYELVNSIEYPLFSYQNISFGILRDGIFMAFSNQSNSFLYFYPSLNIFIQNTIQNYYQISLQGFQFYKNPKILSTFTSNNFYLLFQLQQNAYLARYQASGSQFTTLSYFQFFFHLTNSIQFLQMSSISWYQLQQEINIVQFFTSSQVSINHTFLNFDFEFTTHYTYNQLMVSVDLNYSASNQNCTYFQNQDAIIEYDMNILLAKDFNEAQVYKIQDKSQIIIDPKELFIGNIQNYTVSCDTCNQFEYIQPISMENTSTINASFQAVLDYQGLVYLQDNISLYQLQPKAKLNQYIKLYDFSVQNNTYCEVLFIDMVSQFPVSICSPSQTTIYAYNITSQQVIMHNFSEVSQYFTSQYNNGILQVFTKISYKLTFTLNYFVFYFWIQNNTINVQQIFNSNGVCQYSFINYVYLSMSLNFTAQPCQTFGFIATYISGAKNNQMFLLQTCIPQNISINFGFQPNQTTVSGNIYFQVSSWNLKQTQPITWQFQGTGTMQLGSPKQLSEDLIEIKLIVPYPDNVNLYPVLFNLTNGELIAFLETQIFYLACNYSLSSYAVLIGTPGMFMITNFQIDGYYSPQIYSYENLQFQLNNTLKKNVIGIAGFEMIQINPKGAYFSLLNGNYYVLVNSTLSQIFYVQNYLTLNIDLTGIQQSTIEIQINNPQSQSMQKLFIINEKYQTDKYQNQGKFTLLIVILSILVFIILLVIWYCFKTRKGQNFKSNSFELMDT